MFKTGIVFRKSSICSAVIFSVIEFAIFDTLSEIIRPSRSFTQIATVFSGSFCVGSVSTACAASCSWKSPREPAVVNAASAAGGESCGGGAATTTFIPSHQFTPKPFASVGLNSFEGSPTDRGRIDSRKRFGDNRIIAADRFECRLCPRGYGFCAGRSCSGGPRYQCWRF